MGTIADKLDYLVDTKAAIIERASMLGGITVNDPFRNVADLIYADIVPIGFPNVRKILENYSWLPQSLWPHHHDLQETP